MNNYLPTIGDKPVNLNDVPMKPSTRQYILTLLQASPDEFLKDIAIIAYGCSKEKAIEKGIKIDKLLK